MINNSLLLFFDHFGTLIINCNLDGKIWITYVFMHLFSHDVFPANHSCWDDEHDGHVVTLESRKLNTSPSCIMFKK